MPKENLIMEYINDLKWRYATKQFDTTRKVLPQDLLKIKEAIQLAASSYGLQLYKVLSIEDKALRKKLRAASYDQSQVTDASHFFVFCRFANVKAIHIDEYLTLKAAKHAVPFEDFKEYGYQMKSSIMEKMGADKQDIWTAKQVYIALSNALSACAMLKIDAAPMEGFDPEAYSEILGLAEKDLKATVVLGIGYRSEKDNSQFLPKVRKPLETLFETI